jgi:hypothetical protein
VFLSLNNQAYSIGVIFEGLFWVAVGYLIFKSTFLLEFWVYCLPLAALGI